MKIGNFGDNKTDWTSPENSVKGGFTQGKCGPHDISTGGNQGKLGGIPGKVQNMFSKLGQTIRGTLAKGVNPGVVKQAVFKAFTLTTGMGSQFARLVADRVVHLAEEVIFGKSGTTTEADTESEWDVSDLDSNIDSGDVASESDVDSGIEDGMSDTSSVTSTESDVSTTSTKENSSSSSSTTTTRSTNSSTATSTNGPSSKPEIPPAPPLPAGGNFSGMTMPTTGGTSSTSGGGIPPPPPLPSSSSTTATSAPGGKGGTPYMSLGDLIKQTSSGGGPKLKPVSAGATGGLKGVRPTGNNEIGADWNPGSPAFQKAALSTLSGWLEGVGDSSPGPQSLAARRAAVRASEIWTEGKNEGVANGGRGTQLLGMMLLMGRLVNGEGMGNLEQMLQGDLKNIFPQGPEDPFKPVLDLAKQLDGVAKNNPDDIQRLTAAIASSGSLNLENLASSAPGLKNTEGDEKVTSQLRDLGVNPGNGQVPFNVLNLVAFDTFFGTSNQSNNSSSGVAE